MTSKTPFPRLSQTRHANGRLVLNLFVDDRPKLSPDVVLRRHAAIAPVAEKPAKKPSPAPLSFRSRRLFQLQLGKLLRG